MPTIEKLREQTYQETLDTLYKYKKCALIRPTGFGKTGILTRIIRQFKHVIYVYPAEIIRETVLLFYYQKPENIPENRNIENVTFLSYAMLAKFANDPDKKYQEQVKQLALQNDIVIFDECHRLGATGASIGLDLLLKYNSNLYFLGATATPERMDMIDEIAKYFDDRTISEYNLHDAFRDNILQRPYYFYCNYQKANKLKQQEITKAQKELQISKNTLSPEAFEKIKQSLIEISNIHYMPDTIKDICNQYAPKKHYLRFLCFFSNYKLLKQNGDKLKQWFHEAYPSYTINNIVVTSETDETIENAKRIKNLGTQENHIDLIFSCDMMNLGYHVNDLTGIIMYRGTQSGIVYTQQLGRILSSGNSIPGICLDIVDNIHTQSMYQLLGKMPANYVWRQNRMQQLLHQKTQHDAAIFYMQNNATPNEILEAFPNLTMTDIKEIINQPQNYTWSEKNEKELSHISQNTTLDKRKPTKNTLSPEDLIVINKEATYRDLIRKTVAEAKSMRARQAWARWLEQGGQDKAQDGRPLSRQEILAQVPPSQIPLPPFCYSKQVSVEAVLDEMGIPKDT